MRRLTRALAATVLAAGILAGSGTAAHAQDPVSIPPGAFLVDQSDVLTATEEKTLTAAMKELTQETGQSLYIVYVDEFTSPADPQAWLARTAERKGLGSTDSMLVVATTQRSAHLESESSGTVSAYDSQIFAKYTKPKLAQTDWYGAGLATVEGVAAAAEGDLAAAAPVVRQPTSQTPQYKSPSAVSPISAKAFGTGVMWVLAVIALIGLTILFIIKGGPRRLHELLTRPKLEELRLKAGPLLVALDASVTKMGEASMFAMAQYGKGVTGVLNKDLAAATIELSRLFKVQRVTEDTTTKKGAIRTGLNDLIESATKAQEVLDNHQRTLDGLAEEEANISAEAERQRVILAKVSTATNAVSERLERATQQYEPEALESIQRSTGVQLDLLEKFRPMVKDLYASVSAGKTAEAVGLSHLSRAVYAEFDAATKKLGADWDELRANDSRLDKLRSKVETAIERSKELASSGYRAQLEQPAAAAQRALDASGAGPLRNPVAKRSTLSSATTQFFSELDRVEAEVAAINKARRELPGAMVNASQTIVAADNYIARHRRDVGGSAQSMLTAARGQLQMADLNNTGRDLRVAHGHALDALANAQKAQRRASSDVDAAERRRRNAQIAAAAVAAAALSSRNSSSSSLGGGFGGGGAGGNF